MGHPYLATSLVGCSYIATALFFVVIETQAAEQMLMRKNRNRGNWNWAQVQKTLDKSENTKLQMIKEQWDRQLADAISENATHDPPNNDASQSLQPSISSDVDSVIRHLEQKNYALQVEGTIASTQIPQIIHHMYRYKISNGEWPNKIWEISFNSWKKYFPEPEFRHIFWSDDDADDFFKKRCKKYFNVYDNIKREIVRSDLSRYCILSQLGGIYADLDYEVRQPFYKDLRPGVVNLAGSPYKEEVVQNSLMASPAGHWYWDLVLQLVAQTQHYALSKNIAFDVLLAAGPKLLSDLNETYNPEAVYILPCNYFQPAVHLGFGEEQAAKDKHCRVLTDMDSSDRTIKGIHWGTVSWANGDRKMHPDTIGLFVGRQGSSDGRYVSGETIQQFESFHRIHLPANVGTLVKRVYHYPA